MHTLTNVKLSLTGLSLLLFVAIFFGSPEYASASISYTAGPNAGSVPQNYFYETERYADPASPSGAQYKSYAGPQGLKAELNVKGTTIDNFFTKFFVNDVIFTSADPLKTNTTVTLSAAFHGQGGGTNSGSAGHAWGTLRLNGNGVTEYFQYPDHDSVNSVVSVTTQVPLNTPVVVDALLDLKAGAPSYHFMFLNFFNSFSFDAASVFDLELGVTVNSVSWELQDNQLSAVPLPSALWLFGSAFLGLSLMHKRLAR